MDKESRQEMLAVAPEGAAEVWLLEESGWEAVRGLRDQGLSRKAIARELDLDIKTVRKWLQRPWGPCENQVPGAWRGPPPSARSPLVSPGAKRFVRYHGGGAPPWFRP
jgi:hypothetical protein